MLRKAGGKEELSKAYKKALAKHHPDRAQRSASGWQQVRRKHHRVPSFSS
jgi:DnaJ-class molecular chaperone